MKTNIKVLICIVLLLLFTAVCVSCSLLPSQSSSSDTTPSGDSLQNENTEAITVTETSVTITTLDKWYEFNTSLPNCHYFSSNCYDILRMIILGQSDFKEFESVKLSSWKILRDLEKHDETTLEFSFTVTASELDTLPIGSYTALLHDNAVCEVEFVKDDPREQGISNLSTAADAVCDFINSTHSWSVPIFGEELGGTQSVLADYIICRYGKDNKILVSDFKKLLSDKFGITANEDEINSVIIDNRLYIETQPSHLDSYAEFSIIGDEAMNGKTTVTVVFYADTSRFVKTDIVEYYLDSEERILGCKRIHMGNYDPFELYNTFKQ
ncbi:MAG: hypothetical protein E7598_06925 [Ruminococcaceae bacterium]|nr:hypothetical protein [Oscillospiraceae bacterium]